MATPPESQLRKVLECLDVGSVAQAEKNLAPLIKKFPHHNAIRASNAVVLYRKKETDAAVAEALAVANDPKLSFKADGPMFLALAPLENVLQGTAHFEALAVVIKKYVTEFPDDINYVEKLCVAYMKQPNYGEVQKLAMQLNKKTGESDYQLWAAMANAAQGGPLYLELACRVLDKTLQVGNTATTTPETILFFADVKSRQGKYDEAFAFLCSDRGGTIAMDEVRFEEMYAVLLQSLQGDGRKPAVNGSVAETRLMMNGLVRHLAERFPDNWSHYEKYFDTAEQMAHADGPAAVKTGKHSVVLQLDGGARELRLVADSGLETCMAFIDDQNKSISSQPGRRPLRGPALAKLELITRCGVKTAAEVEQLCDLILSYVKAFGTKPVAFLDMVKYFAEVAIKSSKAVASLLSKLPAYETSTLAAAQMTMTVMKIEVLIKCWLNPAETDDKAALTMFDRAVTYYFETLKYNENLEWSEAGLCEDFVTIACNIALSRVEWFRHDNDKTPTLNSWIMLAQMALNIVPKKRNSPMLLVADVLLNALLHVPRHQLITSLDLKNIQRQTMSYVAGPPLVKTLSVEKAKTYFGGSVGYFKSAPKDTAQLRHNAFKYLTWMKLNEIGTLQQTLSCSVSSLEAIVGSVAAAVETSGTHSEAVGQVCNHKGLLRSAIKRIQVGDQQSSTAVSQQAFGFADGDDLDVMKIFFLLPVDSSAQMTAVRRLVNRPAMSARVAEQALVAACLAAAADLHAHTEFSTSQRASSSTRGSKGQKHRDPTAGLSPPEYTLRDDLLASVKLCVSQAESTANPTHETLSALLDVSVRVLQLQWSKDGGAEMVDGTALLAALGASVSQWCAGIHAATNAKESALLGVGPTYMYPYCGIVVLVIAELAHSLKAVGYASLDTFKKTLLQDVVQPLAAAVTAVEEAGEGLLALLGSKEATRCHEAISVAWGLDSAPFSEMVKAVGCRAFQAEVETYLSQHLPKFLRDGTTALLNVAKERRMQLQAVRHLL